MTKKEIASGNLLIAQFMGAMKDSPNSRNPMYVFPMPPDFVGYLTRYDHQWITGKNFVCECYHTSFNWLFPVINKIETLSGVAFVISHNSVYVGSKLIQSKNKIDAIWKAVVFWLKKYNNDENRKVCPQCNREFFYSEVPGGIFCCHACEHGY